MNGSQLNMADAYPYQPIIKLPKSKTSSTSTRSNRQDSISLVYEPKDAIVSDTLYFDGLHGTINESDVRSLLQDCQPTEVNIHSDRGSGYLRFSDSKMADRVYSLYNGFMFPNNNNSKLQFRISHDGSFEHEAKGPILHVKNLPLRIDNNALYDLFRPFGPLSLCKPIVEGKAFRGTAFIQYFFQNDSDEAQDHMNDKMLEGNAINVSSFMPSKTRPPVPTTIEQTNKNSPSTLTSPSQNHTINIPNSATATPNPNNVDKSDSGYVDYMNLYIKNLDPVVTNNDLFNMFRKFGRIISARVMSNPQTGQSKGYGFVSYDKEEEASAALQEMNGKLIGAKQLIVAYHEPKKPRQEKQGNSTTTTTNNNNISSNNNNGNQHHHHPTATSPVTTTSTNNAMQQPFMGAIGTPVRSPHHNNNNNNTTNNTTTDYNNNNNNHSSSSTSAAAAAAAAAAVAAASATNPAAGMGASYSSHDTRHPYDMSMPSVPISMPSQVNGLGIDNVDQIAMTMKSVGQKRPSPPHPMHRKFSAAEPNFGQHPLRLSPPFSTSPMSGVSSTGPSLASLASGLNVQPRPNTMGHSPQLQSQPHSSSSPQPQQQQSQQPMDFRNNGRPTLRRKGSLESISSVMTESSASMQRQRLMEAVMRCGDYGKAVSDIVDMLLTLKRKERSLCLFNQDFLKEKIQLALDALDTFNDDDDDEDGDVDVFDHTIRPSQGGDMTPLPTNNHSPMTSVAPLVRQQPQQRVSKAIPIVAPPPEPVVPPTTTPATTTTTTTNNATSNAVSKSPSPPSTTPLKNMVTNGTNSSSSHHSNGASAVSSQQVQQIEQLLVSLDGKPTHEKKQQLGDRLFPLVKATGTKQAPKVTIRLLDTIDLHELAHLMYDKDQLKERVEVAFASLK